MAITPKTITTTWQAITAAGESGSCWIVENLDLSGAGGASDVLIYHSTVAPVNDEKLTESKRLYKPIGNNDTLLIPADSALDIYYARCKTIGSTIKINVDVI